MNIAHNNLQLPAPPPERKGWPWRIQNSTTASESKHCPKISVIIPSYNQGQYLEETIRSVLGQGYPNLECILIDGGSSDDSLKVIKKYSHLFAYWVSEKDNGQSHAINKGLKKATGEILGWINSDDLYLPNTLQTVAKTFQTHKDIQFIHGDRILIDKASRVCGWAKTPPFDPNKHPYCINSETAFWKRSLHAEIGYLKEDLKFALDLEFFCRVHKTTPSLKLEKFLGIFRGHEESKSSQMLDICYSETRQEWKNIYGEDYDQRPRSIPSPSYLSQIGVLLANPKTLAIPYLKFKLLKK